MRGLSLLVALFLFNTAYGAEPFKQIIYSCLSGYSVAPDVHIQRLHVHEFGEMDDYNDGYRADYFFQFKGKDIGYAEKNKKFAIIYDGKFYPINAATQLLAKKTAPEPINPSLADWLIVSGNKEKYLCISDNFDGIGRSGSYQNTRYGYLLLLSERRRLYFAADDIRNFKKK